MSKKSRLILSAVVGVVFFVSYLVLTGGISTPLTQGVGSFSKGIRTGYVTKFSEKGTLLKGWEGDLLIGYPGAIPAVVVIGKDGNAVSGNVWSFSVNGEKHPDVVQDIELGMRLGLRVLLHYEQVQVRGTAHDTDYLITHVELEGPLKRDRPKKPEESPITDVTDR